MTLDEQTLPRVVIGSGAACALRLKDAKVARCHAILTIQRGHLAINDIGGANDIVVNGATVKEAFLRGGESVRLGDTILEVHRHDDADSERGPRDARSFVLEFGRVRGRSPSMRRLFASLERLAELDASLILEGEEGTGKELVARELHRASRRQNGPFVVLTSSRETTEATALAHVGEARGGVLFVDRLAELALGVQRVLANALASSDEVRIMATTARPLVKESFEGRFERDLQVVLGTNHVVLPPLRDREGDIAFLARVFWEELVEPLSGPDDADDEDDDGDDLPTDLLPRFEEYSWPGNVRELKAAVHARRVMGPLGKSRQRKVGFETADAFLDAIVEGGVSFPEARERVLREFEGRFVARALLRSGSVTCAARASGLALRQFQVISARSGRHRNAG